MSTALSQILHPITLQDYLSHLIHNIQKKIYHKCNERKTLPIWKQKKGGTQGTWNKKRFGRVPINTLYIPTMACLILRHVKQIQVNSGKIEYPTASWWESK